MNCELSLVLLNHDERFCLQNKSLLFDVDPSSDQDGSALKKCLNLLFQHCDLIDLASTQSTCERNHSLSKRGIIGILSTLQLSENKIFRQTTADKILKYVRVQDQYIALSSLLLKSWATHLCMDEAHGTRSTLYHKSRSIYELPRTAERKPFIPPSIINEKFAIDISVSHQYPFIGLAISPSGGTLSSSNSCEKTCKRISLRIGLDIVMFDTHDGVTQRLYNNSISEFLETYRAYFTTHEWNQIIGSKRDQSSASDKVVEFYLRWAMKEAYTKALGLGLGFSFSSFEIQVESLSLSSYIHQDPTIPHLLNIFHINTHLSERWNFYWIPLMRNNSQKMVGCACICLEVDDSMNSAQLSITQMTLGQLIDYHL